MVHVFGHDIQSNMYISKATPNFNLRKETHPILLGLRINFAWCMCTYLMYIYNICILYVHIIESRDVHAVYQGAARNFQESRLPRQLPQLRWLDLSMFLGLKSNRRRFGSSNGGFWRERKKHLIFKFSILLVFHFLVVEQIVPSCFATISWENKPISVITTCHLFCWKSDSNRGS